ncbi:MAG: DUF1573 domain-containing protein [Nitrospirae bacterium]|nr:DUF1573 domain-containing protein [Nitrospirota bacterium]
MKPVSLLPAIQRVIVAAMLLSMPASCGVTLNRPPDADRGAPARIFVTGDLVRLGSVRQGESARTTLVVKNVGASTLRIVKIETSCACIAVAPATLVVHPSGAANLDFRIDTNGRTGEISETVILRSNDPLEPVKSVVFTVKIVENK